MLPEFHPAAESPRTAVVVGASLAGLLAARVLAERYPRVILIEADRLPRAPMARKGTPQCRHSHALLPSGSAALEALFPGLRAELMAAGAESAGPENLRWFDGGGLHCGYRDQTVNGLYASRCLIEQRLRQRVMALPALQLVEGVRATGLVLDPDRRRVRGLRLSRPLGLADETLPADLVVDAGGRAGRAARWLDDLGLAGPRESRVGLRIGYSTRRFQRQPGDLDGTMGAVITPDPASGRGAVLLAQEQGSWTLTLIGVGEVEPPQDEAGFCAFARELPDPTVARLLESARPLDVIERYAFTGSLRRHYESALGLPDGLVAVGDAFCSFNPIYGQGMSVAGLQALALQQALDSDERGWQRRYLRAAARAIDGPWRIAAEGDLRFEGAQGRRPLGLGLSHALLARVHRAARHDPQVARAFARVAFLLESPTSLLRPGLLWRVLRPSAPASTPAAQAARDAVASG